MKNEHFLCQKFDRYLDWLPKESLFEAEIKRCIEFCTSIESLKDNQFTFTIMDELFTGTNPEEGIAGSYSVCKYLGDYNNSLLIITTHFKQLTDLEKESPTKFKNKMFTVDINNGMIHRSYKLHDGISNQNIAIELLKYKGYNNKIIQMALLKLQQLKDK